MASEPIESSFLSMLTSSSVRPRLFVAASLAIAFSQLSTPADAQALPTVGDVELVEDALAEVGAPEAASNGRVELATRASEPSVLAGASGELTMTLPVAKGASSDAASPAFTESFEGRGSRTSISVQSTEAGMRALIQIDSAASPERFPFEIGGDVDRVVLTPDGGAAALASGGEVIAVAPRPWAVDLNGVAVPTRFETDGNTLTQVVEHRNGDYAYGIVADPWWNPSTWPWKRWVRVGKPALAKALRRCGQGALVATVGLGVGTATTNVLMARAGKYTKMKYLGWQGYVGVAVAGCIVNNLK